MESQLPVCRSGHINTFVNHVIHRHPRSIPCHHNINISKMINLNLCVDYNWSNNINKLYTNHQTRCKSYFDNVLVCDKQRCRSFFGDCFYYFRISCMHTQWVTSIVPSTFNKFDNDTENDQWTYCVCNFRLLTTQTSKWMRVRIKKKWTKKTHTQKLCAKNTWWTAATHVHVLRYDGTRFFCMFYTNK